MEKAWALYELLGGFANLVVVAVILAANFGVLAVTLAAVGLS